MKIVADYLAERAGTVVDDDGKDEFARSAYNRYYYACFLHTRDLLATVDPKLTEARHKNIPDQLIKNVKKPLLGKLTKITRDGKKGHLKEAAATIAHAISCVENLSTLLSEAYGVRVVADYHPEIRVLFSEKDNRNIITLHATTIEEARSWASRTLSFIGTINHAWKYAKSL